MRLTPMVSRYWPFANGSGRILDKFASSISLGAGERIAQTSDGFPMHVYADDLIGRHILMSDVEGFEKVIFHSIAEELKRLQPRAILFEDQTGAAAPDGEIGSILTGAGYRIYGIDKRLLRTALIPVRSANDCLFNDYIAKR